MFERFESWLFTAPHAGDAFTAVWAAMSQAGFGLTSTSSCSFQGRSISPKWGLHRLLEITVLPWGEGANIQVRFRAAPTDEGLIVGVVGAVVLLPAAVVGAAISWDKYENDWQDTRTRLWSYLVQAANARPWSPTASPPGTMAAQPPLPPPLPSESVCHSCHTALPPGARFCYSCGSTTSQTAPASEPK